MKQIRIYFSLLLFLISTLAVNAQWSTNGSVVYYNSGHVGIGTNAPNNPGGFTRVLDVRGSTDANLRATTDAGYVTSMYAVASWSGLGGGFIGTESNHNLHFNTNGTPRMALTTSGNVGIGTMAPDYRLHVKSPDIQLELQTDGSGSNRAIMAFGNSAGALKGSIGFIGSDESISIGDASAYRLVIKQGGNVGVGTTSPSSRLHVAGTGGTTVDLLVNGRIRTGDGANNGGVWLNSSQSMFVGQSGSTKLGFYNNGYWRLLVDDAGKVGIGTSIPDEMLAVKGKIHAEEVKVDLSVPAPDYVFDSNYKLPSLEEIKSYIDANNHLPEIPSAKELEANGITLGEMNMLLLKKIEELTLHVIELKKENDAQNIRINELQSSKK